MTLRLIILFLLSCALALAAPFSTIYFFGDSFSDTGNIRGLTELAHSLDPSIPVFPDAPYFNGRLSNGPLWVEYFAQRLGHPDTAKRSGLGIVSQEGDNFSVGGARATEKGDVLIPFDTGLVSQLGFYGATVGAVDPNALYVISAGSNDILDLVGLGNPGPASLTDTVNGLAGSVLSLAKGGARNVLLVNVPDVGLSPRLGLAGKSAQAAQLVNDLNAQVLFGLGSIGSMPGMNFHYFDLNSLFNAIYADTLTGGFQYGFINPAIPCLVSGAPSCDISLFADDLHPSGRVHQIVGNAAADLFAPVPEPSTIALVFLGLAVMGRASRIYRRG